MENSSNFTDSSFENGIRWWSLEFTNASIERQYKAERISLKRVPRQVKIFCIIAAITNATLLLLDSLSAYVFNPEYVYQLYDVLLLPMYVPIFLFELVFYKWKQLSCLRGSLFTCFIYFIVVYGTLSRYSESVDYPIISPTVLLWHGSMFFIHIFYVRSWIISFVTYSIVYAEIICIVFSMYGKSFFRFTFAAGLVDTLYYVILFAAFIGFSVYAFRTFELKERASFYGEHQARCEMEEWKSLLNDLPEPVILVQGGEITFCNSATQKFFGLASNATDSQVLLELEKVKPVAPAGKTLNQLIKEPIATLNSSEVSNNGEEAAFIYTKTKSKIHKLQLKHVVIRPTVGLPITEYIFHDNTAVEELEREKAQRHCFRLLVATASHDIRTPINAIQGVLDILAERFSGEDVQKELKVARISVKKMELYVRGLACLQHIEVGTLEIDKGEFDAREVVEQVLDYFSPAIEMKGLSVNIYESSEIPPILSDKEKYEIILYHILENSVKYTVEGHIMIKLSYSQSTKTLNTFVIDTGLGMDEEQKKRLFKLFAKKPESDATCPQGIGLGLFLAGSLTNYLGGTVDIDSNSGTGTTVSFSIKIMDDYSNEGEVLDEKYDPKPLPTMTPNACRSLGSLVIHSKEDVKLTSVEVSTTREALNSSRKFSISAANCMCPKVLIVDDEPLNVFILQKFLTGAGIQYETAQNGKLALDAIMRRNESCKICRGYKIVYMDINMPVMNGISAVEKITELIKAKTIPDIPVIAVTAAAQVEEIEVINTYKGYGFKEICKLSCVYSNCS